MKRSVLITGGNKGIGLEVTRLFLKQSYQVHVLARDFSNFEFSGVPDVHEIEFDLAETNEIADVVEEIGDIDVLINNAGMMLTRTYDDYPDEAISQTMKVNLEAPVKLMTEVSKSMIKNQYGRIVNNASVAGQIGHPDVWYGITKAGLINATKSFAKLLGPQGILVNCVAPSPVETDMLHCIPEARQAQFKSGTILNRFATDTEVAEAIRWLGIDAPDYMNGMCLDINNGSYMR
ncbi:3-oxoacyl-[acyl-carrier-protein] reductase FabG [Vibrio aerogenes CECT 7868]|uniref:3-oxoacyl-[acyl-carrier-protein] reductase FabG n=1 Tax=Vibrio aerogenes CECT 7868 TaxID=1216006 RepID=A0A1M6B4I1_9VIBR|nr:SDR family oxidoreductase [Vibrio aerogenes]SHI43567.1 3-oxoacyl-[acyl-carrier-protein] reductase FabG [Vibrio aerogenes CECT 7868]